MLGSIELFQKRLKNSWQYKDLLKQLVMRDIKLKYRRSFLGYLWSVLNPLLIMLVMTVVFSTMFSRNIENFPVYLFTGQMMFTFMNQSTHQAITSITGNAALLKKTYVPKYIFTVAKITSGLMDFFFSLGALLIVMIATRARFTPYILLVPFVAVQLYIFCVGLGMFLAQANVFFRDIQYIYNAITTAWMYLTPIFYPIETLAEEIRWAIVNFNPMYFYVGQFRALVYSGCMPEVRLVIAGCITSLVMLIVGIKSFLKTQDKFVLYI